MDRRKGCPACKIIRSHGKTVGRIGQHHSHACRARIIELMKDDPAYTRLMQKHEKQQEQDQVEAVMQEEVKQFKNQDRKATHSIKQEIMQYPGRVSKQLDAVMVQMLINKIEVVEVYSQPRMTEMAQDGIESWVELRCNNSGRRRQGMGF